MILQIKIEKYKEHYREDTTVNLGQLTGYDDVTNKTGDGTINQSSMGGQYNMFNENYHNISGMSQQMQQEYFSGDQMMGGNYGYNGNNYGKSNFF